MTNSKRIRIALIMAAVLPLALAQTVPPEQTVLPIGSAIVSEVKGEVTFTSSQGTPVNVQRGSTLTAESKIETAKGTVLLELQDASQVLIKAHSNILLKAPNEGKGYSLELFIGKILVKVQKRLGVAPSFRMGTPSAVITVRGTRFSVEVNKKNKTIVAVFEGAVDIAGTAPGSPHIMIKPGFSTGVEQDRAPEQPREVNPGEGSGLEGELEQRGLGTGRNTEDHQRTQPAGPPNQGSEGKPD